MKFKDWIWDKLFLDFYLDKHWTFRFKLLNFLSGGVLLYYVCDAWTNLNHMHDYDDFEKKRQWCIEFHSRKAKYWLDKAFDLWRKE